MLFYFSSTRRLPGPLVCRVRHAKKHFKPKHAAAIMIVSHFPGATRITWGLSLCTNTTNTYVPMSMDRHAPARLTQKPNRNQRRTAAAATRVLTCHISVP